MLPDDDNWIGAAVAISGDTVVVRGYSSAYIFQRSGTLWRQQVKLLPSGPSIGGNESNSQVAISGDTVVIGISQKDAVYVYQYRKNTWEQQAKLTASDDDDTWDQFGISVAISGQTIIVGANWDDEKGEDSGSAYIFRQQGKTWQEQAKLTASDTTAEDDFGKSVAISGNTVVVGAHGNDDAGGNTGSAYIFRRRGNVWQEQIKLTASDGAGGDNYGGAVAISEDNEDNEDSEDAVVVGAANDDDGAPNAGSVYVYQLEDSSAITLLSFGVEHDQGHIMLTWQTGTEIDTAGFNLYRATAEAGPYLRLNETLIPSQGTAVSGASYSYGDLDTDETTSYYYKLEDVDIHGASTFHGPILAPTLTPAEAPRRYSTTIYLPLAVR